MNTQQELYEYLRVTQGFSSNSIGTAFNKIDRGDFVTENFKELAYEDTALPIGSHATISQPSTVLFMLNCLDPQSGEKILDVGSGSGWTTALLASIVGKRGKVVAVELMPELVEVSVNNLAKYNFQQIEIHQAGLDLGFPGQSPFDRILVSAAAKDFPQELVDQLKVGGRILVPIKNSVWQIDRISEHKIIKTEFEGFVFVPLK